MLRPTRLVEGSERCCGWWSSPLVGVLVAVCVPAKGLLLFISRISTEDDDSFSSKLDVASREAVFVDSKGDRSSLRVSVGWHCRGKCLSALFMMNDSTKQSGQNWNQKAIPWRDD